MQPSDRSRGFGRNAAMAAAGGAVAGMALGYGLGRFPRPPFSFHSPQEEQYYNHYMYRRYGTKSTDTNDYGRDYKYSQPPDTYDSYMASCMKRTDLLPGNRKPNNNPAATTTTATATAVTTTTSVTNTTAPAAPGAELSGNTTKSSGNAAGNSSTSAPSTPSSPLNESEAKPAPPASRVLRQTDDDDNDDDTVSIVEIGYPALVEQMKARRCVGLYMVYSEKYLKKTTEPGPTGGARGLEAGLGGLLAAATLMLLNSNTMLS